VRDHDASYVEFVTARQDTLRRIAYAVCRDDARAEDVLQEALVKLYLSWGSLREAGREEAFARRIIVNADLDQRRRPWHRRRAILPVEHYEREGAVGPAVEDRADLLAALRQLPVMQRRTVVLRYWLGLSVEETADELGIRAGTVKSHSSRGLAALRALLTESVASG
jgi:RNA polymerase sigma-70 factor (sigma-E family)